MTATQIFTVFAGILALTGVYLYFFGIDPETKRALEKKALKTMGENKMSYLAKGMFVDLLWAIHTNNPQTRSTRSLPRIRKTSRTSRRLSAMLSVVSPTTPSGRLLVKAQTDSQLPLLDANGHVSVVRAANQA